MGVYANIDPDSCEGTVHGNKCDFKCLAGWHPKDCYDDNNALSALATAAGLGATTCAEAAAAGACTDATVGATVQAKCQRACNVCPQASCALGLWDVQTCEPD